VPILDVSIVGPVARVRRARLASRLADAAADVLGAGPGSLWVRLHWLARDEYAENGGGPPRGVMPVFVTVLERRPPAGRARAGVVARLTAEIARACGRPVENVHVLYEAAAAGRMAFGGRVVPP
jgi:phenylpyruvate tautomerase PptA (4-oxalocrotonate tautomerase family)